jgi:hypothetical protein
MSHYTVQYLDHSQHHQSICEYAEDAFSARNQAVRDVPYLYEHPNKIDAIMNEDSIFSSLL